MTLKIYYLLIAIPLLFFTQAICKQLKVLLPHRQPLEIRTNSQTLLQLPDENLTTIYSTSLKAIDKSGIQMPIPECQQLPVQISFEQSTYYQLNKTTKPPPIIYNFEDIKLLKYILDVIEYQDKIWILLENGQIHVVRNVVNKKQHPQIEYQFGFTLPKNELQSGYFFVLEEKLYFVNQKFVFYIDATKQKQQVLVHELKINDNFKTAIPLSGKYFAIAYQAEGIKFFKAEILFGGQAGNPQNTFQIQLAASIKVLPDPTTLNQSRILNIQDLLFDEKNKRLYILDHFKGVYYTDLQITDGEISAKEAKNIVPEKYCNLFKNYQNSIFMSCQKGIIEVTLNSSTVQLVKTHVVMSHPQITVKDMFIVSTQTKDYKTAPLIFFVGTNSFRVYYMNKTVQYNENHEIDKLIIKDNFFIAVSQNWIKSGLYTVIQHRLKCKFQNNDYFVGTNNAKIITQAECRSDLINGVQFSKTDTCIYEQHLTLIVWQPAEIQVTYIGLVFIVSFICVGLTLFVCCLHLGYLYFTRQKLRKKYNLTEQV